MDISIIFKIAIIGIVSAVINMVLKKSDKDEIATVVTIVGLVVVLAVAAGLISDLFDDLMRMFRMF